MYMKNKIKNTVILVLLLKLNTIDEDIMVLSHIMWIECAVLVKEYKIHSTKPGCYNSKVLYLYCIKYLSISMQSTATKKKRQNIDRTANLFWHLTVNTLEIKVTKPGKAWV